MTPRHAIEHLHLTFCRLLCAGPDRSDFVIKGGCNLRFFFGSVRYSEDLDLDVRRVPPRTLRGRVDKLLESPSLASPLRAAGLQISAVSAPKQTDTTQRWKVALQVSGLASPLPTKIEFSRRDDLVGSCTEPVDTQFASAHRLQPVLLPHYPAPLAIAQKIRALVGRTQVQARDLFDLSVLFARVGDAATVLPGASHDLGAAAARALELSYDDYAGQVVPYLDPEHSDAFGSRAFWDAIQLQVVATLERAEETP